MKYTDNEIREYDELNELIKALTKKRDAMKDRFIQSNGGESDSYLIVLKETAREIVAGKKEFEQLFGKEWLRDHNLLNTVLACSVVIAEKNKVGKVG